MCLEINYQTKQVDSESGMLAAYQRAEQEEKLVKLLIELKDNLKNKEIFSCPGLR
jgi:hypothetical protein